VAQGGQFPLSFDNWFISMADARVAIEACAWATTPSDKPPGVLDDETPEACGPSRRRLGSSCRLALTRAPTPDGRTLSAQRNWRRSMYNHGRVLRSGHS